MAGTIVWFRNDLRLDDHPAMGFAVAAREPVVPVYCWHPQAAGRWAPGGASRWWLHRSLESLRAALETSGSRLVIRQADPAVELIAIARQVGATAIACNRRFEPWAVEEESRVERACEAAGLTLHRFLNNLMFDPAVIRTGTGVPYKVFTPFWKNCMAQEAPAAPKPAPKAVPAPASWPAGVTVGQLGLQPAIAWDAGLAATWEPGEAGAARKAKAFLQGPMADYAVGRDLPGSPGTSMLSPHLAWGEVSPRRVWHAVEARLQGGDKSLRANADKFRAELGWREFGWHVLANFPATAEHPLRPEFRDFPWQQDPKALRAWQRGGTGYPLIDAGMRQLWHTGWMHNRVRMSVSSFLVKHLRQHWLHGADWFWDTLVDADLASNTLGWQWSAGCGADAAPYFRIFNPMLQGEKFDGDGAYVKRWVPELAKVPADLVHRPWEAPLATAGSGYPPPIVDHAKAREAALAALKACNARTGAAE
ncbi:MAG: deoxyribodipyrimidine photo-lyase [Planctomycetes bacterium]|nr:deoxyribodipyrimidine photo-lyase [Planctomycetota bacterium]